MMPLAEHLHEQVLHHLEGGDRSAELLACLGVAQGVLEGVVGRGSSPEGAPSAC
jgi:hypothetical protein